MTTIYVAHEVSADAVKRVEALLSEVALRDPNWNGAQFIVERGEFTCIAGNESYEAAALLYRIHSAIQDESE